MKMDTQGMSADRDPNDKTPIVPQKHKPAIITPRRLFTECMVKELKILINEVLDEREGKFDYVSYFDTEHYKHFVGDKEPPYKR